MNKIETTEGIPCISECYVGAPGSVKLDINNNEDKLEKELEIVKKNDEIDESKLTPLDLLKKNK